ncbi:PASTA domain-containing protein [Nitrospira sp. MA-1]|nr:PASTA domain-containing protein [Nitrospira sp. MA-1]
MNVMKVLHQNGLNFNLTCQKFEKGFTSILLRPVVLVSLLFLTCALPATAGAEEVPNVVGSPQATAEAAITSNNLLVGVVTPVNSPAVPIGTVISQDPAAGINVVPGSPVDLVISGVAVPNVVGLAQTVAQTAIAAAGLTVGAESTVNSGTVPIGDVISQTPAAGTNVLPGNAVTLVVSLGTAVPDLVGMSQSAAVTAITTANLTVGPVTTATSTTVPAGVVISQSPAAGSNVPPGSAVTLVVSLGAKVPNVVGLTQAAADTALTKAGLTLGAVTTATSETVPAGTVISQSPVAESNVAPGTAVSLVVSLGVVVPKVVGLTQAAAESAITTVSLTVGRVTKANSSSVAAGRVISQNPAAEAKVKAGSAVDLVVSLGAKVPNVVEISKGSAQTALSSAGLKVGKVTSANSQTVAVGNVISQDPPAGSNVAPGSAVDLVVSLGTAVPTVVNKSQTAAQTAITNVGLTVGNVTSVFSEKVPIGNVTSQTPKGGENVDPGSSVELVISSGPPVLLMGVQNDPKTGPLVNSLYRLRTDGVVTKIGDLKHRTHGLAYVGANLYSVEELTLAKQAGTPPNLYRLNPSTGATLATIPLSLSTGESLEGGRGLATMPGSNQLWALLVVTSEVNSFRRLVTINPTTGLATQKAKLSGNFMDLAFDAAGTLYAITDNRPVSGGAVAPARIYTLNKTTGAPTEFLNVSAGAVAGQPNFRESETIGVGSSPDLLYHLSGQHKVTSGFTKNILFEQIHRTTKARTAIPLTGPDFFVTTALTLVPSTNSNSSTGPPALADLDASGTTDLIWQNSKDGTTAIWLMNGTTIAATGFPGGVPAVWQIAGVGDVNGDGKGDVIWRNGKSGTVAVWLMNGVSVTSVGFPGSASTAFEISGVGDVNGDGKADLVWRNTNDGSTAIWLMNGTKIAAPGFPGGVPVGWQIAGVGDVNGDSKADVIWRNGASGTVAVWLMNGLGIAGVGFPGSASPAFKVSGVGDVNGDGKADLVWRNTNDGSTAIWLMNGTKIAAPGFPGGVPVGWQIAGVGDVNGDSKADVIWRNGSSGTVAIWLMNGVSISNVGFPGSAPSDWEIQ